MSKTATAKTETNSATPAAPAPAPDAKKTAAVVLPSRRLAMPANAIGRRGSPGKYDWDGLAAPVINDANDPTKNEYDSFGVKGHNKKSFQSTLHTGNKRYRKVVDKLDENGAVVRKMTDIKDAEGKVVGQAPGEVEKETITEREFIAVDVDPKTDPDGAELRIFRVK
jgi:hypothetical protein